MSEAVSALPGAVFEGAVTVREGGLRGMVTLRGDLGAPEMAQAVQAAVGQPMPGVRQARLGDAGGVLWFSPDELLLLCPYDRAEEVAAQCAQALSGTHHLAVNVSDARALFVIEGAGAREVLAKGAPVDLAPEAFGPGEVRRTRLGQVAVAFWMTGEDSFELVCFRSVAQFVFDWLANAAAPGSLPEYF